MAESQPSASGRQEPAPKDWLEEIMGSMKSYQWIITLSCYLIRIPMAWHLISHGILMPGITPVYCNTTTFNESRKLTPAYVKELAEEACSSNCPQVLVGTQFYKRSIIGDFELYCDRLYLRTASQFMVMAGVFFGCLIFGVIGDKYGRKWPLIVAELAQPFMGIWVAFSPNIISFLIAKFFLCFFVGGTVITAFVLFSEIVGRNWRPYLGIANQYPFALAHASLSAFAYVFYNDWRYFQLAVSLPSVLLVYYIFVLPESPRWLLATRQVEKGIENLERIAKCNGLPYEYIRERVITEMDKMEKSQQTQAKKGRLRDLFQGGYMSLITIAVWVNWLAVTCAYFGIAELSTAFTDSFYLNNALAGLVQLPAVTLLLWTVGAWGRKWSQIATELFSAVGCFGTAFTPPEYKIIPASIAMFGLSACFPCAYVFSAELFPTVVRSIGVGSASSIGRVGGMLSPMFTYLNRYGLWIPLIIFAVLCSIAGLMCFLLPETMGKPLVNTVEEINEWKKKKEVRT